MNTSVSGVSSSIVLGPGAAPGLVLVRNADMQIATHVEGSSSLGVGINILFVLSNSPGDPDVY